MLLQTFLVALASVVVASIETSKQTGAMRDIYENIVK